MKDKAGNELNVGDVCFYSEMPYSNYADSIIHIYEHEGKVQVETLIVNGLSQRAYIEHERCVESDLELSVYSWDYQFKPTDTCDDIFKLDGVTVDMVSIDYANENFPLEESAALAES